jgi:diguanylate cyclase (GGDEF)-like protein/PAS domain S-box-containing protein
VTEPTRARPTRPVRLSLWSKLTLAGLLVQATMLILLVVSNVRLTEEELIHQTEIRVASAAPLLNAALSAPLMQRDYATLREILEEARNKDSYAYLVLLDRGGSRVAATGLDAQAPLPPVDADVASARGEVFHTQMPIILAGLQYGELHVGVPIGFLAEARARVVRQGIYVALVAVLMTLATLALIGYWLTRRLNQLTQASHAIAAEDFDARLPSPGSDEVGQLVEAFHRMSGELKTRMAELRASEQRFFAIANFTYDLELWLDPDGRAIWVNPSVIRITGFTPQECMAMPGFPLVLIDRDDRPEAERLFRQALSGHSGEGYQFRMARKDGGSFWAAVNWHPIYGRDGEFLGIRASIRDISELKASEQKALQYLATSEAERARMQALLAAMNLGILFVDGGGRIVYHNPAFSQLWRIPPEQETLGADARPLLRAGAALLTRPDAFMEHVETLLTRHGETQNHEIATRDGRTLTLLNYAVRDRGDHFLGHLWIFEDVTGERQTAEQLLYLAERDSLTGLYNRHRFQLELERMLAESGRHGAASALLYFDLDEFKAINDHFGHRAGDTLLMRVAGEVANLTRKNEMLFRLGGDEFAVLLPGVGAAQAEALAERIVRAIAQIPFRFEGQTLHISSSLGIALYPTHATDQDQLVACADTAMYQAKHAGKNAWRVYRADLDTTPEMVSRLSWNERIARALEQDLFELHFQGVYHARSRRLSHLEALIRMRDEHGEELIAPGRFIPVAEKSNKILEIDRWVLRQVADLLARYPQAPPIAVNISGRSLDDPALPGHIAELLRERRADPARLLIEVTETAAVSDLTDAERFIEALKHAGCGVCLDDFGAGFASFAYLKHIRVDTIKLDGMFIRNLPHDHANQVFVRGMVEVARGLDKNTVAECVEDEATLRLLADLGVEKAQGFFLDRPQARHPALYGSPT